MSGAMHSIESEQSVIGGCLLHNGLIDTVTDMIGHRDFFKIEHQIIWAAIVDLRNAGTACDVVTVSERLEDQHAYDDVGGLAYLAEIVRTTPGAANVTAYAGIISDLSSRRKLRGELSNIESMADDKGRPFSSIVDDAQGRLSRLIRADADQAGLMSADLAGMIDELDRKWNGEESAMGLSFGLTDLDSKTMGMQPGQFILVAGRPAMGKTAFALNILRACCVRDRRPALIFSMEMDRFSLRNRMTAAVGNLPLQALRDPRQHMTDEHWPRVAHAVTQLKDAPLIVDERSAMTPNQIRGAAKRWRDHYGDLGVVMVDYLQLMKADGKHASREQEVAEMSRAMKTMAKELGCPVVALSQLNRSLEQRPNKRPMMSDLRESGALEQDADIILFMYRDEIYNPDNTENTGIAEIIVGKQREGETGTVFASAQLSHARFSDLDHASVSNLINSATAAAAPKKTMAVF